MWRNEWGAGEVYLSHGSPVSRGVGIFVRNSVVQQVSKIQIDLGGRYILLDIEENGFTITLVAVYAPNEDKPCFFDEIQNFLKQRSENKIIVGDFNLVLDVDLDRKNTYNNNNKSKDKLEDIMDEFCLKDVWRIRNENSKEYSWFKKGDILKASRIDFALVSGGLDHYLKEICYISSVKTDHRAIYMVVELNYGERGAGFWKFNNMLLQDKNFVASMNEEIMVNLELLHNKKPKEKWEILKQRIKKYSVDYARKKASEQKIIIAQLSEKVNDYESRLPLIQEEDKLWNDTKQELEEKLFERVKGNMFRSKVKWYEDGEKNTKYFFSLEKARYNAKTCYKLISEDQQEIVDPEKIIQIQRKFYEDLYSNDEDVEFKMKNIFNVQVSDETRNVQNTQISMEDLQTAIRTMNNNKTPGFDGIPVDFYKVFWNYLKKPFMDMLLECYEDNNLHRSAKQGVLNLIPKANKDTRFIKNLRPITLLNTDYKIIEKAIANKMLPALNEVIHKDQRGFMKDRRISVNIRKMLDIMHYADQEDLEAVILSLDFVKCFDKCSFSILHGSLEFFNFGNIVKEWTHILYHDFSVMIQNNGNFSSPIPIQKGVHQGGCCSSVYFLVIAEILALSLRSNEDIDGIPIKGIKHLLNQFADDMDIGTLCNEKSIKAICQELERFRWQSGFTVSYEKTTLYRIGSLKHSCAKMYNIDTYKWSNEDINVLGVTVAHEEITKKNYKDMPNKVKNILNSWHNRGLTLMGKILVVNTLVASLFVYKMMVLPAIPESIVKNINNIIREFLWNKKKAKIAYNILQNSKEEGGLELVNLKNKDHALKATWPQILHAEQDYATIVYHTMRCSSLGCNIWRCSLEEQDVKDLRIKNKFWEHVLLSWTKINYYYRRNIDSQILWYNSKVKIGYKTFFWKDAYDKGLIYIYQLFDTKGYKPYEMIETDFGLSQIRYNSLKAAIPMDWKEYFTERSKYCFLPLYPTNYDMCIKSKGKGWSKIVYEYLRDDVMIIHNKYLKWLQDLGQDFCQGIVDFGKLHKEIYSLMNVPKYRSFQYRLLQRAIVTNVQLKKWNVVSSNLCYFCVREEETLNHLFFECQCVQDLWANVINYLEKEYPDVSRSLNFNIQNVILNRLIKGKGKIINFICLVTKQYIYRQRCQKGNLSFVALERHIKQMENVEKYIAIKNNRLNVHVKKWSGSLSQRDDYTTLAEYVERHISENC